MVIRRFAAAVPLNHKIASRQDQFTKNTLLRFLKVRLEIGSSRKRGFSMEVVSCAPLSGTVSFGLGVESVSVFAWFCGDVGHASVVVPT